MPKCSVDLEVLYQKNRIGPDIFGFYKQEIADLLAQDVGETFLPLSSKAKASVNGEQTDLSQGSSLFSDSIRDGVPDFKRELLKSLLRQSVGALTEEVDEVVDPVIRARHIISFLRSKKQHLTEEGPLDRDSVQSRKRQKISSSNAIRDLCADKNIHANNEAGDVNEGLKFLLETEDSLQLEETITRHSDELEAVLNHMQGQLEELLDTVVSKCRLMTQQEKQKLCKLIQELPPKNLDRVVEIIQAHHGKSSDIPTDEIFVDLDEQGNVTLWRLYFYVKAVQNARRLSA